ncbi:hypothetical protein MTR01_16825 [Burkholderia thailandensis]|uniref:hypothetical protein n=1 Tax=Burkholderia thailandensis TaxID=57975 RepID=UPI0022ABC7EA|nr:hypothetical protein [Burkholderia thailandensis]MCZ2895687.1 hypothetical protein [Burkholderia thailandensis]
MKVKGSSSRFLISPVFIFPVLWFSGEWVTLNRGRFIDGWFSSAGKGFAHGLQKGTASLIT